MKLEPTMLEETPSTLCDMAVEDKLLDDALAELCERVEEMALLIPEHVPNPDWQPEDALQ
jgi:hypothetical protein